MARASLKEDIIRWLAKEPDIWIPKGLITSYKWSYPDGRTYLPETVGRNLREAESESRIAVREKGVSIEYRFLPVDKRSNYIPVSQRKDKAVLFKI